MSELEKDVATMKEWIRRTDKELFGGSRPGRLERVESAVRCVEMKVTDNHREIQQSQRRTRWIVGAIVTIIPTILNIVIQLVLPLLQNRG